MTRKPMEWEGAIRLRYAYLLCFLFLTYIAALPVQAALLRLNPDDDTKNVIEFEGAIEATIIQSASGMDIIIPGVKFTLDCEGVPAESCNLSVASASPSQPSAGGDSSGDTGGDSSGGTAGASSGDTGGDSSGDTGGDSSGGTAGASSGDTGGNSSGDTGGNSSGDTGGDSSGTSGDPCEGKSGFGAYNCEDGAGTSGSETAGDASGSDDDDDGFGVPTEEPADSDSSGDGWGLTPSSGDTGVEATRGAFPASGRIDFKSSPDVGSASSTAGRSNTVALGLTTVTVLPFTMSSTPISGGVSYADTTLGPQGADLAIWISKSQDGDAVSGCSKYGGIDGQLKVSSEQGIPGCVLEPGGQYFLNLAACVRSKSTDYACRDNALTGYTAGEILLVGRW